MNFDSQSSKSMGREYSGIALRVGRLIVRDEVTFRRVSAGNIHLHEVAPGANRVNDKRNS